ncbi:signal recognition particle subunit SRP54 [Thermotomaculum hydrothermale]|uniref:Signal recognition particle protein n=1 Tax=Thermotomaculum hydrothermale TaxID=981385 RepID=A0A7R6PPE3_9BACT|nr:signal recognition particle protein [Thermotomaculum hydrothermale]BBB31931.1 signal recognition particle subunit SRP54 [Thermotomaculum hydrothermale]
MFDQLTDKLNNAFRKIKGVARITERNIEEPLREIRMALLEADVNYKIVKQFTESIKQKALGVEVSKALNPGQQFIKIVHDELVKVLGEKAEDLKLEPTKTNVIMMVGLQGSGKTTSSGKLAAYLKKQGFFPLLVPADVYRPAAIEQLKVVGKAVNVPVFDIGEDRNPVSIAKKAVKEAKDKGFNVVIIDTAGRLHIDEELMKELKDIEKEVNPDEILFTVDSMTGQDAVKSAAAFDKELPLTGVVLTKLDGDARGGAALSVKFVTGKPIKFVGVGEKYTDFEKFHPDRMASRILGMGDVMSLIEKAEEVVDKKKAEELQKKIKKDQFTLEDFRDQLLQLTKMGSMEKILGMIPGMANIKNASKMMDDKKVKHLVAIINSMTPQERRNHQIINGKRRKRIARGSGRPVQEVNQLLKQFVQMKKMMKQLSNPSFLGKMKNLKKLRNMDFPF